MSIAEENPLYLPTSKQEEIKLCCKLCGLESFESRNKLYKHVKICSRASDQSKILENVDLNVDCSDKYIYVTGGRCRGRTLGSVERYSLGLKRWEACTHMLENRGMLSVK